MGSHSVRGTKAAKVEFDCLDAVRHNLGPNRLLLADSFLQCSKWREQSNSSNSNIVTKLVCVLKKIFTIDCLLYVWTSN
jgi:hypothetical protein